MWIALLNVLVSAIVSLLLAMQSSSGIPLPAEQLHGWRFMPEEVRCGNPCYSDYTDAYADTWKASFEQKDIIPDEQALESIGKLRNALDELDKSAYGGYTIGVNPYYTHVFVLPGRENALPGTDCPYAVYHKARYSLGELEAANDELGSRIRQYSEETGYAREDEIMLADVHIDVVRNRIYIAIRDMDPKSVKFVQDCIEDENMYYIVEVDYDAVTQ